MCWPFVSFFVVWNTFSLSASFTRLPKSWVYFPHKFTIGRNWRRLLWNWLVAWVSVLTNVKSTHAICALVSGYWGCKKWPRDHVWVVRQKHFKCQGNQTEFFLHFLQNLANCAENVTTPTHRQSKQNVCLKNRSHGGFIAYSRLLLYCIVRILHQSVFVGKNTMCWVSS